MTDSSSTHTCPNCMAVLDSSEPSVDPTLVSSDILETNDPPQDSQIPLLRDFVRKGRARMNALNAKIALLQSTLDNFRQESENLDLEIRKHEGGFSPLRRVPTEILSHIFTFTLPPHHDAEPAPWIISAVCSHWRAIVISQPSFWSFIQYQHLHRKTTTFRLETQLLRSGDLPLNIEFFTGDSRFRHSGSSMLETICQHAGRWEKVSISGRDSLYVCLGNFISGQLALLRELTIEMFYAQDVVPSLGMFNNVPSLQQVVVNKKLWAFPVTMVLPWSQLLRYSGSNTWDGHLLSLRGATNLVDCSLEIRVTSTSLPSTPILLPHLLRLSLSHAEFLECLETPALSELYCDYAPPVLPFLHRQSCKLRKLVMWECSTPADDADLPRIVDAVPTITNLVLPFPLPAEFAHEFCSRPDMAPTLECISIDFEIATHPLSQDHFYFQNELMQAIESRWQGGRLKSLKVLSREFASGIFDRMMLLQSQGMEFRIFPWSWPLIWDTIPLEMWIETTE